MVVHMFGPYKDNLYSDIVFCEWGLDIAMTSELTHCKGRLS